MSEDDEIEGLQTREEDKEEPEKVESPVLTRRASQDVELSLHGEIIQMPSLDVQRFQRENQLKESPIPSGTDRAQGTIEQIADIWSRSWNKRWRNAYAHEFPNDGSSVSNKDNFDKFQLFLQNRLGAWQSRAEQVFGLQNISIQDNGTSCKFRLPWKSFDEQTLPERHKE